jgi:type IX secretion system PorP/SprF family membrane protein
MKYFSGLYLTFLLFVSPAVFSQEVVYGPGYQLFVMNNPAFAGSNLDGALRLAYTNFLPGNNYKFHSVFCSYDSYFSAIHGGAGFYISNDYQGGIINDLRSGLSYSYFLQAGREFFINAGLSASLFHRGFNFSDAVFPDQINPLGRITLPPSEIISDKNTTVLDVGTGFIFIYRNLTGGFSINHLTQPDLGRKGVYSEKLKRRYLLHLVADIGLNKREQLKISPIIFSELQDQYFYTGVGAVLSYNFFSVNTVFIVDKIKSFNIQTGFSIKRERLTMFYNYRFNVSSGNSLMPFSQMHQTGLTYSLNKVEKRIKFKTINLPVM